MPILSTYEIFNLFNIIVFFLPSKNIAHSSLMHFSMVTFSASLVQQMNARVCIHSIWFIAACVITGLCYSELGLTVGQLLLAVADWLLLAAAKRLPLAVVR